MCLNPENYPVVWHFKNDTASTVTLYLEMVSEEVVLEIGDEIELLARPSDGLLPLDIAVVEGGFQIHAYKGWDPHWHVRFNGRVIKIECSTRLADYR